MQDLARELQYVRRAPVLDDETDTAAWSRSVTKNPPFASASSSVAIGNGAGAAGAPSQKTVRPP